MVGVQYAANSALHHGGLGVDEGERVSHCIGDDEGLFVRRTGQVVRFFAGVKALGLFPSDGVYHADAGVLRIEHEDRLKRRRRPDPHAQKQRGNSQKTVQTVHKCPKSQSSCRKDTRQV